MVDYRDRISVGLWVVMLGLAATLLVKMPSTTLVWMAFGSPLSVELSTDTFLGLVLIALAASATEAVVSAHPLARAQRLRNRWMLWALPCALVSVSALLLPTAPTRLNWLAGLALTGATLGLTLAATYHIVDPESRHCRVARVMLTMLTYGAVLLLFLGVYRQRARSLFSATLIVAIGTLLALELLRGTGRRLRLVALHAVVVGVVLGEGTWAMNYWNLPGLTGGLLLLLGFYLLVGIAHQGLMRRLGWREMAEFGVVGLAGVLLIAFFAP